MLRIKRDTYTKLNLGSGDNSLSKFPIPWLNVDIKVGIADYISDVRVLPLKWTGVFDEVRASHVLEHLFLAEWQPALQEWVRVLKPGGILRIIVPDLDIVIKCLLQGHDKKLRPAISGKGPTPVLAQIFGLGYENPETEERWRHRIIVNKDALIEALSQHLELAGIKPYPQNLDPGCKLGIKDDSQNQFSLCVQAQKIKIP